MKSQKNPYEGVEDLKRFNKKTFIKYCNEKIHSVDKHIAFLKRHVVNKDYKGRVIEIGSGNGKLLFRMEKEGILKEGFGFETSKSRCKFSNKFKNSFKIKNTKIINKDFLTSKLKTNYFDLIIGTDVVINLIGGLGRNKIQSVIKKCEKYLKTNGKLILEFMTFEKEKKLMKVNRSKKILIWKKFKSSDPFIFGLDEMSHYRGVILWQKYFIPRKLNDIKKNDVEYFRHKILPINKNFFLNKKFSIFNEWSKNDDTDLHEFIAMKKIKNEKK